jgi:hypothetical protein
MSEQSAGQRQAAAGLGNKVPDIEPTPHKTSGVIEGDHSNADEIANMGKPKFRKISDILAQENGDAIVHNFDGDKMAQYRLTALATGGACVSFEEMPTPFDLKYWFCHRVEMVAQGSGEFITPIRTVLISKTGQAVSFVSDGIARELDTLRSLFGEGPYTDPMPIAVTKIATRAKTTTYTMGPA